MTRDEFDAAVDRVQLRHGDEWAAWLVMHADFVTYGPTYCRAVADSVRSAFRALAIGAEDSACYWQGEANRAAVGVRARCSGVSS